MEVWGRRARALVLYVLPLTWGFEGRGGMGKRDTKARGQLWAGVGDQRPGIKPRKAVCPVPFRRTHMGRTHMAAGSNRRQHNTVPFRSRLRGRSQAPGGCWTWGL